MTTRQKRIFLHPGEVRSKRDGQWHYVTAQQLARLYHVDLRCCVVIAGDRPYYHDPDDEHLYPRVNGDYWNAEPTP